MEPGFRYMMSDRDKAWEKINDTRAEFAKLHYDWLKHLTTLCTGSLLVISALSGSVFADFYRLRACANRLATFHTWQLPE